MVKVVGKIVSPARWSGGEMIDDSALGRAVQPHEMS